MKFESTQLLCGMCIQYFAFEDDEATENDDGPICKVCSAKRVNDFLKQPCQVCKKSLNSIKGDVWTNEDEEAWVHKSCGEKANTKADDIIYYEPQY